MSESVIMPALGESVSEGTVSRWLKKIGDTVEADEALLEVSTDKVDSEVPAPVSGVITEILVPEDETVSVGTVLCIIGENSTLDISSPQSPNIVNEENNSTISSNNTYDFVAPEPPPVSHVSYEKLSNPTTHLPDVPVTEENITSVKDSATKSQQNISESLPTVNSSTYVTPIVRKMAKEHDIDLSKIIGTGIGGRIRRKDVQDAIDNKLKVEEKNSISSNNSVDNNDIKNLRGTTTKMSRLRQVISKRMIESINTSAQLTSVVEVDCSNIWSMRQKHKNDFFEKEGVKLTFLPFFVKIVANALRNHPKLNASIIGDEIKYHDYEHIGIAVDTERGLLVPVIKDVSNLSTTGIAKAISDIANRARNNGLTPNELSGSTFTITNTGSGGTIMDTPIINQPEVAILGIPKIIRRPVVVTDEFGNETIGIRPMIYLCLSYDHRLIDGADAARFLQEIKTNIESGNVSL